ncbi:Lrp/AsnC family transcriptional regulator [Nocardioides panaciterrulae]|uniref:DNA-binding Lrp family transcriptional regulator n=1 Tax=Nocardioides panaciterrulae TaxID=661492 RepID=A0A7Y9E484_9ACTN|nr:Lrp/AsnC family transcriptional regulator [Nocardioides panaciterrulae]NYD40670.1 DNA-binding Lrp family transcriptional regulator [Nocardioides panaciterrulae]
MPKNPPRPPGPPPRPRPALDEVDRLLVAELLRDGRAPNTALARAAGIAESTCLARVRALRERGIVTGVSAEVDLARLGLPVQAMVAVRFSGHLRADVDAFAEEVSALPGVVATYNISGANDFLVHVAAPSPEHLRDFVLDNLTGRPGVVQAETSLVFHVRRGTDVLST